MLRQQKLTCDSLHDVSPSYSKLSALVTVSSYVLYNAILLIFCATMLHQQKWTLLHASSVCSHSLSIYLSTLFLQKKKQFFGMMLLQIKLLQIHGSIVALARKIKILHFMLKYFPLLYQR
jgi:hypothetical protein